MGYRLQMSAEFHDWLAELRDRDPSGRRAGGAGRWPPSPPKAITSGPRWWSPWRPAGPDELLPALDRRYQAWLETMTGLRRRAADVATLRRQHRTPAGRARASR